MSTHRLDGLDPARCTTRVADEDGIAGPPRAPVEVPGCVDNVAAGSALRPVWRNVLGGLTSETDDGRFVK